MLTKARLLLIAAALGVTVAMAAMLVLVPTFGAALILTFVAFYAGIIAETFLINSDNGIVRSPVVSGNQTIKKYIAFFMLALAILITTLLGNLIVGQVIQEVVESGLSSWGPALVASLIINIIMALHVERMFSR